MKRLAITTLLTVAAAYFFWRQPELRVVDQNLSVPGDTPHDDLRGQPAIKLPQTRLRQPATQVPAGDPEKFLSAWWTNFPPEERQLYTVRLESKTTRREVYQVYFKNQPVESLRIVRKLLEPQAVEAFPPFKVASDGQRLTTQVGEARIRATEPKATQIKWNSQVWVLGANQTLHPAYTYSVVVKDNLDEQTWTVNAHTGDIVGRNAYSRN